LLLADFEEEYNEIVGCNGGMYFSAYTPGPIRTMRSNIVKEFR
jgi:hypothetical protein